MIRFVAEMQSLEIRDDIYERFLAFKVKYNPSMSNEEFMQFLMSQFESCCSNVFCNSYTNGTTEFCSTHPQELENTPKCKEANVNNNSPMKEKENVLSQLFTCPECKFVFRIQKEIEQHFNECHDIGGAFPCTCGQCFSNLSQFLAHYIICPIAATDLQNNFSVEGQLEEKLNTHEKENYISGIVYENVSPIAQSPDATLLHTDDSNEEPLNFHIESPSYSNPLNLVKNENRTMNANSPVTDDSSNKPNIENNNDGNSLPENLCNKPPSRTASSPSNPDQPKKVGKIYECDHCEKNFKSKGLLDQHKHLHFPPRHECEFCGRRFRWPPQFYTHKQQCSKRKQPDKASASLTSLKTSSYKTCAYNGSEARVPQSGSAFSHSKISDQCLCGYNGGAMNDMYEHKRSCVASARALILQKIMDYKTIQNSTLGASMPHMNGSLMDNFLANPTSAELATSTSRQSNKNHEMKPFECDFCESRFMTKISLKQHLDGKHSDQAKYCCEKCGKGYFWNASYNYHKKKCVVQPLLAAGGLSRQL